MTATMIDYKRLTFEGVELARAIDTRPHACTAIVLVHRKVSHPREPAYVVYTYNTQFPGFGSGTYVEDLPTAWAEFKRRSDRFVG